MPGKQPSAQSASDSIQNESRGGPLRLRRRYAICTVALRSLPHVPGGPALASVKRIHAHVGVPLARCFMVIAHKGSKPRRRGYTGDALASDFQGTPS